MNEKKPFEDSELCRFDLQRTYLYFRSDERANARKVSFITRYGGQFTFSSKLI